MTIEQYLDLERADEWRNEFYKGQMRAMPHGSLCHAVIKTNLASELGTALKETPWAVLVSVMRVRASLSYYTYPDILVLGEAKLEDAHEDTLLNPTAIVEVFSPETEADDRGFKFAQYRTLESLQEYGLVSQNEPKVEVFRRLSNGDWSFSESVGLDTSYRFESVKCSIPLAEIYDKVTFE